MIPVGTDGGDDSVGAGDSIGGPGAAVAVSGFAVVDAGKSAEAGRNRTAPVPIADSLLGSAEPVGVLELELDS